jgi:hypothetical protein
MRNTILAALFMIAIASCKKKDNDSNNSSGSLPTVVKIDTAAVLKGSEWKLVYHGIDTNHNGIWESEEMTVHFTTSFHVLTFKDNDYMTDSAVAGNPPHAWTGIDGFWHFIGPNKSQILFSHDSMAQNYATIREITDSTLNLCVSPNYWWIFQKYKR